MEKLQAVDLLTIFRKGQAMGITIAGYKKYFYWIYRRGDVYLADCGAWHGSIQSGIRPVVVVQNDTGSRHSPTLSVVKLTTKVKKKPGQPTHYVLKNIKGIPYSSQVLAEQPDTINKTDVIRYMAHLSESTWQRSAAALKSSWIC